LFITKKLTEKYRNPFHLLHVTIPLQIQ